MCFPDRLRDKHTCIAFLSFLEVQASPCFNISDSSASYDSFQVQLTLIHFQTQPATDNSTDGIKNIENNINWGTEQTEYL